MDGFEGGVGDGECDCVGDGVGVGVGVCDNVNAEDLDGADDDEEAKLDDDILFDRLLLEFSPSKNHSMP
jgi:hypothetical protein